MGIKERLNKGENIYGTWCTLPSSEVVNVIAKAGLDFIIIDMEHGTMDHTIAQQMVVSAQSEGCNAIVRTSSSPDRQNILRSLDIGSDGIIVPHINTVSDVKKCIEYSKYPPIGNRSFSPYTRCGGYSVKQNFFNEINNKSFLGIIIEDDDGLNDIESIIDNEYIDMVYIGTYDIASSLNCSVDDPKVKKELERCAKIIRDKNKSIGCLYHNKKELDFFKDIGINFLV